MTWSVQVDAGDHPVWVVGISDEMRDAAQANQSRDTVQGKGRTSEEKSFDAYVGNLGELVVQDLLIQGSDAPQWEYVDESETDLLRDGSLALDVKTRDLGDGWGNLLVRRRMKHKECGGAVLMGDGENRRCVKCGAEHCQYYREELKSDIYLLVHIDSKWEFAYVFAFASKPKVEQSLWNESLPTAAHELTMDELDDASKLLGWA
jgi:hypothetical protein